MDGGEGVRLRTVDALEYERLALPWYADPDVLRFSESSAQAYDVSMIRRMFESLSTRGELYVIEVDDRASFCPVGDAALLEDALPIAIGVPEQRSRRVGTRVLRLLVRRACELGWNTLRVGGVLCDNVRALRMYEGAGVLRDATPHLNEAGRASVGLTLILR